MVSPPIKIKQLSLVIIYFPKKKFVELKLEASKKIVNLDQLLKEAVKKSISRYTKAFRLH